MNYEPGSYFFCLSLLRPTAGSRLPYFFLRSFLFHIIVIIILLFKYLLFSIVLVFNSISSLPSKPKNQINDIFHIALYGFLFVAPPPIRLFPPPVALIEMNMRVNVTETLRIALLFK